MAVGFVVQMFGDLDRWYRLLRLVKECFVIEGIRAEGLEYRF